MITFALVHGAWHGGWCWERLHAPLRARGRASVAVDLPCDDPEAGNEAYAGVIAAALADVDDDVVVVAHSLAGLAAPWVASLRPVRAIVYLAAFVPVAGQSMGDQFRGAAEPVLLLGSGGLTTGEDACSRWADADATARLLHPDLSPADARWAFPRLRPQAPRSQRERHPSGLPDVPVVAMACAHDRVVNPDWSRRITRERFGTAPLELPTGHFPMITAPELLADALTTAVA